MAKITPKRRDEIVAEILERFPCYGKGSRGSSKNPIANSLQDQAAQFAFGVQVADVVDAVVELIPTRKKRQK